jgi:hypothetical protein
LALSPECGQAIEVFAQSLAQQHNSSDAKAAAMNLGRDEVLISLVWFGLADVPDRRLIEIVVTSYGTGPTSIRVARHSFTVLGQA